MEDTQNLRVGKRYFAEPYNQITSRSRGDEFRRALAKALILHLLWVLPRQNLGVPDCSYTMIETYLERCGVQIGDSMARQDKGLITVDLKQSNYCFKIEFEKLSVPH